MSTPGATHASSANDQFSRYRALVTDLAQRGLAVASAEGARADASANSAPQRSGDSLRFNLALPAARLLLRDDPTDHAGLVAALRTFADLGRPHLTVGVNVGTLAAPGEAPSLSQSPGMAIPGLCDEMGHTRDVYYPFALHLCLAAFHRRYESLPANLWSACEQALLESVAPMRTVEAYAGKPPPPQLTHLMLWQALCVSEQAKLLQRDIDLETIDAAVHAIVRSEENTDAPSRVGAGAPSRKGGALAPAPLHQPGADDSPDAWTWRELTGLHALANLALLRRNAAWARRVEQIALYHLEHTQPDNTTNQPWALFAFLWSARTRSFGEQQLHDASAQGPSAITGALLADAANALAEFAI